MPLNNFNIMVTDNQNPSNHTNLQFKTQNQQYGQCGSGQPPLFKMEVMMNNLPVSTQQCCINPESNTLLCSVVAPQKK